MTLVKYQCQGSEQIVRWVYEGRAGEVRLRLLCPWSGLFPLEDELTAAEVRQWFCCPSHGDDATDIQTIRLQMYREERRQGKRS